MKRSYYWYTAFTRLNIGSKLSHNVMYVVLTGKRPFSRGVRLIISKNISHARLYSITWLFGRPTGYVFSR